MFCDECGKQVKDTDVFCTGCGHKITKPETIASMNQTQISNIPPADNAHGNTANVSAHKKKSNKGLIITISVCVAVLFVFAAVFAFMIINKDAGSDDDRHSRRSDKITAVKSDDEDKEDKPDKENKEHTTFERDEKTELIIGYTLFEPFNYYENGELVGFDTELAEYVCKELGLEPVFKEILWDEKEILLESGEIDCIWNAMVYTSDRDDTMSLSDVYLNDYYYNTENETTECDYLVIGFKKDSELTDRVNEIIDEAKENGTMNELLQKYIFYRVKLSAEDTDSQIGAFLDFEKAKELADSKQDEGYKVFDAYDNLVYNP